MERVLKKDAEVESLRVRVAELEAAHEEEVPPPSLLAHFSYASPYRTNAVVTPPRQVLQWQEERRSSHERLDAAEAKAAAFEDQSGEIAALRKAAAEAAAEAEGARGRLEAAEAERAALSAERDKIERALEQVPSPAARSHVTEPSHVTQPPSP
jgi:seryl-tRNA synthetase